MAVPTITCRASCVGLRRTSAFTTSITYAGRFPVIDCRMCCGITRSSPLSDESRCSRVCGVNRSLCAMRIGVVSFHLERQPYIEHPFRQQRPGSRSKIMGDQVVRTPASANIHLGGGGAYQVAVGIERVQKAGLIETGIWLKAPQRREVVLCYKWLREIGLQCGPSWSNK